MSKNIGNQNNMKALLEINDLHKQFGDLKVLKGISVQVNKGEVVSIIGPSGSGKSTLLRCATKLETPDSGDISYGGSFGLVFQDFHLFPHFSVLKNVMDAPLHVQKRAKEEVEKQARELLEKVGLNEKADAYPGELSGGQQQRVAIARALAMNPDMLFFDEPTSALDPEITAGILKVLRQLANEKMTMIIVTHEIAFARNVSDRVIFMDGGVVVEEGTPEELIDNPKNQRTKEFLQKLSVE